MQIYIHYTGDLSMSKEINVQYICTSSTMYIYDGDGGLCRNSLLFPNIGCYYFDSSFTVIQNSIF